MSFRGQFINSSSNKWDTLFPGTVGFFGRKRKKTDGNATQCKRCYRSILHFIDMLFYRSLQVQSPS